MIESNRILKEVAQTLYISALEIISYMNKPEKKIEICKECKQKNYSISKGVYDLIRAKSKNEKLAKWIKKEYGKRSNFLHQGTTYSSNNYLGYHIPQVSTTSSTGNVLQHSLADVTYSLRVTVRQCILDEFLK